MPCDAKKKVNGELTGVNERERAILPGFHMGLAFRGFILLGRYEVKLKHTQRADIASEQSYSVLEKS